MPLDEILVRYQIDVSPAVSSLKTVQTSLEKTEDQSKESTTAMGKHVDDLATKTEGRLTEAFKRVGSAIIAAFSVEKIINFTLEAKRLSIQAEDIRQGFSQLNDPILLAQLRKAVRGTVDDLTLMQQAIKANALQIPLQSLSKLFEFAKVRADQLGKSTTELTDTIIQGIGIKSTRALAQLGISEDQFNKEVVKTGDYFTALGDIITTELDKAGKQIDDTGDKQEQLNATFQRFKLAVGDLATGDGSLLHKLTSALNFATQGVNELAVAFGVLDEDTLRENAIAKHIADAGLSLEELNDQLDKNTIRVKEYQELQDKGKELTKAQADDLKSLNLQNKVITQTITALNNQLKKQGDNIPPVTKAVQELKRELSRDDGKGLVPLPTSFIQQATTDLEALAKEILKIQNLNKFGFEIPDLKTSNAQEGIDKTLQAAEDANKERIDQANITFDVLTSLQSSFDEIVTESTDAQIAEYQRQLDAGKITAYQFDKEKKKLLLDEAKREKAFSIFSIILGTARAIINALGTVPPNPFLASAAAVTGAAELAVAASRPLPAFSKGVIGLNGAGTETSDSIYARLSRGESVITAKATRAHKETLKLIQQGKSNDEIIASLLKGTKIFNSATMNNQFDDDRIVRELSKTRYEAKQDRRELIGALNGRKKRRAEA